MTCRGDVNGLRMGMCQGSSGPGSDDRGTLRDFGRTAEEHNDRGQSPRGRRIRPLGFIGYSRFLAECLHQLIDGPVQVFVGTSLLVDLSDGVHYRRVVLATELTSDLGK